MKRTKLVIAQGKESAILRRHPWVFSGAVQSVEGVPEDGDLVDIYSSSGQWLATGHYQSGQSIICKILSFDTPVIDEDFYYNRLKSAIYHRRRLGFFDMQDTNVFRLVHAEGDNMPGLICDWYDGIIVMQAHSVGMHRCFSMFVKLFCNLLGSRLKAVFDKSSATLASSEDAYIYGIEPQEWEVREYGNHLVINFYEGQKTGFFIDQRENRHLVQQLSAGHRVMNCFGYTGGFSLSAMRGNAQRVETVDISKKAIELCNRNVRLNFRDDSRHRGVVADVLQYLSSDDARFFSSDFIILDPPAFAKNHRSLKQGLKGYRSINQRAMELLPQGGLLMTFSCSQAVSQDDFRTMIFTAAANARREVRIVRQLPHAIDHPVSIYHPEGEYLKGLLLEIE